MKDVSVYAYRLSKYITTEISKYKLLKDFYINVGAAYGKFYDFEFTTREGFSELTTIGYAANFAAKLQSFSGRSNISISEDIYDVLSSDEKKLYVKIEEPSIEKYGQDKYYKTCLYKIASSIPITDADLAAAKSYAMSIDTAKPSTTSPVRHTAFPMKAASPKKKRFVLLRRLI